MADLVYNIALGRVAGLAALPNPNDALVIVPLESAGLVADSTMRDYATLADILAGATNEQTSVGRKTITTTAVTVNNTLDRVEVDAPDAVWTSPSGNAIGAFVIGYVPDTTSPSDSTIIPLTKHVVPWVPDGNTFTLGIADFFRASSAA